MVRRRHKKSAETVKRSAHDSAINPQTQGLWNPLPLAPSQPSKPGAKVQDSDTEPAVYEQEEAEQSANNGCLLTDVSVPEDEGDLCVHKTKVAEFKLWLEEHPPAPQPCSSSRMLLLSGPPGCGKSTLLHVVAKNFGYSISKWTAPTPTLWSERHLLGDAGPVYVSKMGAFNQFIGRAKYPCLQLTKSCASDDPCRLTAPRGKLIVVDDLPYTHSQESQAELIETLKSLALSACHPTVCVLTSPSDEKGSGTDGTKKEYLFQNSLKTALEEVGVGLLSLPAVNQTNMMRVLKKTAEAWGLEAGKERLQMLCSASNGDLRNALHTLQVGLDGNKPGDRNHRKPKKGKRVRGQSKQQTDCGVGAMVQKDATLSMFHALGKILYNKRADSATHASDEQPRKRKTSTWKEGAFDQGGSVDKPRTKINPKFWRPKSNYNPEEIIAKSVVDGQQLCSFLSEHYLHFMKGDALEEASLAADYLCCADLMSRYDTSSVGSVPELDLGTGFVSQKPLHQVAAESVAVRGIMFSNTEPQTGGGMYKFYAPKLKSVESAKQENLASVRTVMGDNMLTCTESSYAEVILPMVRQLGSWLDLRKLMPSVWAHSHEGSIVRCGDQGIEEEPGQGLEENLPQCKDWPKDEVDYIED